VRLRFRVWKITTKTPRTPSKQASDFRFQAAGLSFRGPDWVVRLTYFTTEDTESTEVGGFVIRRWPPMATDGFDSTPIPSLAPHCRGERVWVRGPVP
jgi:hypothetical protein